MANNEPSTSKQSSSQLPFNPAQSKASTLHVKDEPNEYDEVEILEYEPEQISVADDDDEFNVANSESSVIKFINVRKEHVADKLTNRPLRTYGKNPKSMTLDVKTEKVNEFSLRIKDEPADASEITNFDLLEPSTSLVTNFKIEPNQHALDLFDLNEIPRILSSRSLTSKRMLPPPRDDNDLIPNPPKSRRIVQGTSPYTSSLPLKPSRRIAIDPATGRHVNAVVQNFKCQYCSDKFANRDEIIEHIKEKHQFKCLQCPAQFPYKITLIQHQMSEHTNQTSEQTGRLPVAYRHSCPVCRLKFSSNESLAGHLKLKHKITKFNFNKIGDIVGVEGGLLLTTQKPKEPEKVSNFNLQLFKLYFHFLLSSAFRKFLSRREFCKNSSQFVLAQP